jgi:branched-chain amino acid transport system permease protein
MRTWVFLIVALIVAAVVFAAAVLTGNDYLLFAGYVVLQFVVLATAWNILGGYCGYVNFGSAAFFAMGAYATVALHKLGAAPDRYLGYLSEVVLDETDEHSWLLQGAAWLLREAIGLLQPLLPLSLPTLMVAGGIVAGVVGIGMGYLTLRLRGVFFAIATLAMAVVLHTIVVNWDFVGGSRGAYILRPDSVSLGPVTLTYVQYLFLLMLLLAVFTLWVARTIERSRMGLGFATIRDDEAAAEASGVPTLRLKLIATAVSGALMGMAGAPLPYYIGFVEPGATFGLQYGVNAIAMPMIGGTSSWAGPLVGAVLLGTLQQVATVTISSVVNLLIVGAMLVAFVIAAPVGIVGLIQEFLKTAAPQRISARAMSVIVLASYCFIAGMLAIIFNLPVLQAALQQQALLLDIVRTSAFWLGAVGMLVGALYIVAAYGLLKLLRWAPLLTNLALLLSAAWLATLIGLNISAPNVGPDELRKIALFTAMIAVALAGLLVLLSRKVRLFYNPVPA